jgi:hypothetical protein
MKSLLIIISLPGDIHCVFHLALDPAKKTLEKNNRADRISIKKARPQTRPIHRETIRGKSRTAS